jgi:hypothetical protein
VFDSGQRKETFSSCPHHSPWDSISGAKMTEREAGLPLPYDREIKNL